MQFQRGGALRAAALAGLTLVLVACGGGSQPAAPATSAPAPVNVTALLLTESDVPGFTRDAPQESSPAAGLKQALVTFTSSPRVIVDTVVEAADANSAMLAYQGGVEAAAAQPGAEAKQIAVGDQSVRYDVAQTAQGVSQASVVVQQGKYFIVIGFASTPGDLPTDDVVLSIVQRQVDKVKAAG